MKTTYQLQFLLLTNKNIRWQTILPIFTSTSMNFRSSGEISQPSDQLQLWPFLVLSTSLWLIWYNLLFTHDQCPRIMKRLWTYTCTSKLKGFACLLINDRLNTRDIMEMKNWQVSDSNSCVLHSGNMVETRDHLSGSCPFSQSCWDRMDLQMGGGSNLNQDRFSDKMSSTT